MPRDNGYETMRAIRAHLAGLPIVDPERRQMRDMVPGSDAAVIKRAMKYGNASPEFKSPHVSPLCKPLPKHPIYPSWRFTRQSPCLPFESGENTLPGMEAFK
jgi:hypothetical protein